MVRGVVSGSAVSGVGDIFVMKMYFTELGEYHMINHVVEYEPDRRIGWEPEAGAGTRTLSRGLSARPDGGSGGRSN
jgi:hypothetical protein